MQKIISLFKRDYEGTRLVYDEIVPGAEWGVMCEGVATEKWDGTACLVRDGKLYKRYDAKKGRTPPANFEPAQAEPDEITGHFPGWVPVGNGTEDKYHRQAWNLAGHALPNGTYELVGENIQGNPYDMAECQLLRHGSEIITPEPERTFDGLKTWFKQHPEVEGIVWHHPDGRMVKVKARDFGLPWPPRG